MYDLLILAFNEDKPSHIELDGLHIKALNENGNKSKKYYCEIWPFINDAYGILYKTYTDEGLGEFECCDEMFEFGNTSALLQSLPNPTNESLEDCVSMAISAEYNTKLRNVLDILLSCSPISTIAFLCRGQSSDNEIVLGSFSLNDFVMMLDSGKVLTNICYIVRARHKLNNNNQVENE